jgi:hypothetical protein
VTDEQGVGPAEIDGEGELTLGIRDRSTGNRVSDVRALHGQLGHGVQDTPVKDPDLGMQQTCADPRHQHKKAPCVRHVRGNFYLKMR